MMEEFEKILADQESEQKDVENELRAKIEELLQKFKAISEEKVPEVVKPHKERCSNETHHRYKAVKGDHIDELFVKHLNKANIDLEVKRISQGHYMFGSKRIQVKIVNDKLLIRVGGGVMSVDEYIEQYGKMEVRKLHNVSDNSVR